MPEDFKEKLEKVVDAQAGNLVDRACEASETFGEAETKLSRLGQALSFENNVAAADIVDVAINKLNQKKNAQLIR